MASYRNPHLTTGLIAALVSLACLACGGGGGGGGGGSPTAPQPGIVFTASGSGAAESVELRRQGAGGNTLTLEVRAVDVADLYGLAFDVEFPANLLSFTGFTDGGWLSGQGSSTELLVTETAPGVVVVGLSRLGTVDGRSGSGLLLTLQFNGSGSGTGSISFQSETAFDSDGFKLPLSFAGGTVRVTL